MFGIGKQDAVYRFGRRLRIVRKLAVLLCLVLCLESAPLTVLAAEPGIESLSENTAGEGQNPPAEDGEEQEPSTEEGQEPPAEDGEEQEPSVEEGEGQEPPAEDEEEQEPPAEDGEEQEPSAGDGEGQESSAEDAAEQDSPAEEDWPQVSGNDVDTVSGNDASSVSENDLESVSENSLDAEREAMILRAQEAFAALGSEKPLMALLYHTDSYEARKEADADSTAAATLEIGQTLYLQGVEITEDDVWYRAQYLINGAEGAGYIQSYYLAYSDEDWLAWEEEYLLPILQWGEAAYEDTAYGMRSYSMMTYAVDTSDISAFPGSYQADLRSLKSAHPN